MRRPAAVAALLLAAGCALHEPLLSPRVAAGALPAQVELAAVPFFPQEEFQCGPAALATVLAYSGLPTTPDALAPRMMLPARSGALQIELVAAARAEQRIAYVLPATLDALLAELRARRPVLVLLNLGLDSVPIWHFAVVVGYSAPDETFMLRSGTERHQRMQAWDFARRWALGSQWAMVVLKPGELPTSGEASRYLASVSDVEATQGAAGLSPAYRAALRKWPDNRVARFGLASALDAEGQHAAARREYRALLAANPDDLASLNNLADVFRRTGCRTQALETIERALAAAPATHPLRPTLERTRSEVIAMPASGESCPD